MRDKLLNILNDIRDDVNYENEQHLLTDEILDSFDILELISEICREFKIEIDVNEINSQHFDNIDSMEKYVLKHIR